MGLIKNVHLIYLDGCIFARESPASEQCAVDLYFSRFFASAAAATAPTSIATLSNNYYTLGQILFWRQIFFGKIIIFEITKK